MARQLSEIQSEILAQLQSQLGLTDDDLRSSTSVLRIISYVVAQVIWTLENLFDFHKKEVDEKIAALKPHSLRWYVQKAKSFQYGAALVEGEDYYDNSALNTSEIEAMQIVSHAAASDNDGAFRLKVATNNGGELEPLNADQFSAFSAYVGLVKDAGVGIELINVNGDSLKLTVDVYYDPLILTASGARTDGTSSAPVEDAIYVYINNLPFDGLFVKSYLIDAMQAVEGVFVPEIRSCATTLYQGKVFTEVDISYQPYSGYLKIYSPTDLQINYIANV